MSTLNQFLGTPSSIGDVKARALVNILRDDGLHIDGGQHWLKAGTYLAYSPVYASLLTKAPGLLRLSLQPGAPSVRGLAWLGTRFVFLASGANGVTFASFSATKTGAWTQGVGGSGTNGSDMAIAVIKTGANAGRVLVGVNNGLQYYDAGSTNAANAAVGGATRSFVATVPDGSLATAWISNPAGTAGDAYTSADGGTTWTSRTPTLNATMRALKWAPSLAAFVLIAGGLAYTSANGHAISSLLAGTMGVSSLSFAGGSGPLAVMASTPTATLVRANATQVARHKAGAWTLLAPGFSVAGLCDDGSGVIYAHDGRNIWKSTDDGDTWQGPSHRIVGEATAWTEETLFSVAPGAVAVNGLLVNAADPVGAVPDAVGATAATASLPGSATDYAAFVRIK